MGIITSDFFNKYLLQDLVDSTTSGDHSGALDPSTLSVGLYTNAMSLDNLTTFGDFEPPTSTGLEDITPVVWEDAYARADGAYQLSSDVLDFTATAVSEPETIRGYYVYRTDGSSNQLLFSEEFENPVNIHKADDAVLISLSVAYDGQGATGSASLIG